MSLSKNIKCIIVLPLEGSPYIWKNAMYNDKTQQGKSEIFKECSKVVRGMVEPIDISKVRIHPLFKDRWAVVSSLLGAAGVELYGNEEAMYVSSPNMATAYAEPDYASVDGMTLTLTQLKSLRIRYRPLFGELAVVCPYSALKKLVNPNSMKLVKIADHCEAMGVRAMEPSTEDDYEKHLGGYIFEPEDSAEGRKFKDYAKSKGWFINSFGMTYEESTGRPDAKPCRDYDSGSESESEEE